MSNWYALFTVPRKEQIVQTLLQQREFETFSPSILEQRRWSDRVKRVEKLLFPGYVFCRFDLAQGKLPVVTVPGVQRIIGHGRDPIPVPDHEIEALQRVVGSGAHVQPHDYLQTGDRVRIINGSMKGVEGLLSTIRNETRVVISIELLQRSVAVEVALADIQPLEDRRISAVSTALSRASFAGGIQ